jgi:hypothetical protein
LGWWPSAWVSAILASMIAATLSFVRTLSLLIVQIFKQKLPFVIIIIVVFVVVSCNQSQHGPPNNAITNTQSTYTSSPSTGGFKTNDLIGHYEGPGDGFGPWMQLDLRSDGSYSFSSKSLHVIPNRESGSDGYWLYSGELIFKPTNVWGKTLDRMSVYTNGNESWELVYVSQIGKDTTITQTLIKNAKRAFRMGNIDIPIAPVRVSSDGKTGRGKTGSGPQ